MALHEGATTQAFDWVRTKRPKPFSGGGNRSKLTARCPHCGSGRYGYYGGRFKQCPACGFHRQFEQLFDSFAFYARRDRLAEIPQPMGEAVVSYWHRVYGSS